MDFEFSKEQQEIREKAKKFVEVSKQKSEECGTCEFSYFCRGGCRRHYEPIGDNKFKKNYFCSSFKEFYQYAIPRFYEVVRIINQ